MLTTPQPILWAGLKTLHWGLVHVRNATISAPADIQKINQIAEALHEIPTFLMEWDRSNLEELRMHLRSFDSKRWPGAPDLTEYFNQKLREYEVSS